MIAATDPAAVFTDPSGLAGLRRQSRHDPERALDAVARQFEALFLHMMLTSMREASLTEGALSSGNGGVHTGLFDAQLALSLSQGRGLGLAELLRGQLSDSLPAPSDRQAAHPVAGANAVVAPTGTGPGRASQMPSPASRPPTGIESRQADPAEPVSVTAPPAPAGGRGRFASPQAFVAGVWDAAVASAAELGVDPQVLVAQAAHETGWGRSVPRRPDGSSSHNLFGIKAGPGWQGPRVTRHTLEVVEGVTVRQRAAFRAYDSVTDAFRDYVALVGTNPRYRDALASAASPEGYLRGLQEGGYATDPLYGERVLAVLQGPTLRRSLAALKSEAGRPI
jgi:flagellar protein FlgJ